MRVLALALLTLGGAYLPLDRAAIDEALTIANSSLESTHRRFHADYRLPVSQAPVDFVSLVTPFRRLVLAAETAERLGRRMFGQREALEALRPDPDRFEVFVELTFHPHNTFVQVPDHAVVLEPISFRGPSVVPLAIDRFPRFGPRLDGGAYPFPYPFATDPTVPSTSQPLVGGTLLARFAGDELDPKGAYDVVVKDGAKALARIRIDLARVR